jgi:Xaa-Pro dipeptidase
LPAASIPTKRANKIFEQIDKDPKIKVKPNTIFLANGSEPHFDYSFFYVTGFRKGLFERSCLIAERDSGKVSVFTSVLEEELARASGGGIEVYTNQKNQKEDIKRAAGSNSTIGVNGRDLTLESFKALRSIFKGAKFVDVGKAIVRARSVKDESEIRAIEQACEIASKTYSNIPSLLKDGITESEIAAELVSGMQSSGGSGVAFESIVSFGKNSALPHYSAGEAKLSKGQFVLLDYGTKVNRYCSDITRTLVYGNASSSQKKMYELVKRANEVGIENCIAGRKGVDVHKAAAEVIDSSEYKGRFIHSLGHPLGLAVHDPGIGLSINSPEELEPGMVLTVEPGIYVPSLGGVRIEDDVLITKSKPRVLTTATKDMIIA